MTMALHCCKKYPQTTDLPSKHRHCPQERDPPSQAATFLVYTTKLAKRLCHKESGEIRTMFFSQSHEQIGMRFNSTSPNPTNRMLILLKKKIAAIRKCSEPDEPTDGWTDRQTIYITNFLWLFFNGQLTRTRSVQCLHSYQL